MNIKSYIRNHAYLREYGFLFVLSILIGIIGGLGAILFRFMIDWNRKLFFGYILPQTTYYVGGYNIGIIALPALGGLIIGPIIYKYARETKGHGVPEVIEAVHFKGGIIRPVVAFVKILVSSVTIGSGGSAGREGPIAQIGAVFGSLIGKIFFKSKKNIRLMVCCGVAAGISATFNAPLGGAIFAMEVISMYPGLVSAIPILVSAVVGDVVMAGFFGFAPACAAPEYTFSSISEIPIFVIFGLVFGVLAFIWSKSFYKIEGIFDSLSFPEKFKPMLGGLLVGILGMIFFKYGIMGVGYEDIDSALTGNFSLKLLLTLGIVKVIATSFTVGSGGSGGIFAPSLYIGAMFGAATGVVVNYVFPNIVQQPYAFALIGMGALFAGACRAPVTALVMIPEMTRNHQLLIPMIIVSTISYLVASSITKSSMYWIKLENRGIKRREKENVLEDITVSELMTRQLVTISPDMYLSDIVSFMLEKRHPGFPVVGKDNKFYGFIKIYDLAGIKSAQREKIKVKKIVNTNYPHVIPEDNAYHALNLMTYHNIGRLPVLVKKEDYYTIIGIISKTDIIRAYERIMK